MNIERLPIAYQPPFDCVNDNATCPVCTHRRGNHGVCGSRAIYAVRAEHEGLRYAVTLEMLGDDYLPITRQWWQTRGLVVELQGHRPTALVIHHESPHGIIGECTILGEGRRCQPDTGFLSADVLFNAHGSRDASIDVREQPKTLWTALERCLVDAIFGSTGGTS
jgi:hypothetical protein